MMPLIMANTGESVTVKKITGNDEVRVHLKELGFVENSQIKIMNKVGKNLIVQVKDSRIAIDNKMATRIMIQ